MNICRARTLSRAAGSVLNDLLLKNNGSNFKQSARTKVWVQYRKQSAPQDYIEHIEKPYIYFSAALWSYFIWYAVSNYEEVVGPRLPKMSDWTDEELGIPPLDEDP